MCYCIPVSYTHLQQQNHRCRQQCNPAEPELTAKSMSKIRHLCFSMKLYADSQIKNTGNGKWCQCTFDHIFYICIDTCLRQLRHQTVSSTHLSNCLQQKGPIKLLSLILLRKPELLRVLFICISKINMISETNWPLPKRRIYFSLHIWLFVRIRSQVFLLSSIL